MRLSIDRSHLNLKTFSSPSSGGKSAKFSLRYPCSFELSKACSSIVNSFETLINDTGIYMQSRWVCNEVILPALPVTLRYPLWRHSFQCISCTQGICCRLRARVSQLSHVFKTDTYDSAGDCLTRESTLYLENEGRKVTKTFQSE